jgi:hypothetical protein
MAKSFPTSDITLGNPPPNVFIPENLEEKKVIRDLETTKPAFPKKISEEPLIWFK